MEQLGRSRITAAPLSSLALLSWLPTHGPGYLRPARFYSGRTGQRLALSPLLLMLRSAFRKDQLLATTWSSECHGFLIVSFLIGASQQNAS